MWPVSDEFLTAVASSHLITTLITVTDRTGYAYEMDLVTTGGTVTIDATRAQRRSLDLTLVDPDGTWAPTEASSLLSPASGNEIQVARGVVLDDGTPETVPLGVFRITRASISETGEGTAITLAGVDRSWVVTRALWTRPWSVLAGHTVERAIDDALRDRYPDIEVDFPTTGHLTPALNFGLGAEDSSDPWAACQQLAEDAGFDLYFDAEGICRMTPSPDPSDDPVIAYGPDDAHVVISDERTWDGDAVYNGVVVTAENSALPTPLRAESWDMNPASATYRYGPFGEIPDCYSSSAILTQSQAQDCASERLRRHLGVGADVTWSQIVNPALDAGDVVRFESTTLGIEANVLLDTVTIPLTAEQPGSASGRTSLPPGD